MSENTVKQRTEVVRQQFARLERDVRELPDLQSGIVAAVQDLAVALEELYTALEELSQQPADQNETLINRLYTDRRLEESQARLIQSEKMSALGQLTASVVHEINNPLQAIQGCLALVREGLAEEAIHQESRIALLHDLDVASSEVTRIAAIMQRLREFYRPARADVEVADVNAVLDAVFVLTARKLEHSHVALERIPRAGDPTSPLLVRSNADQLKQVFLNLVLNAIEALPDGGTLRIATGLDVLAKQGKSQPAVRIDFADTGKGIPPETLTRVFEPFFTTKENGSGLGLAISHELVEAFGGELTVTSQVGQGSTFTVWLLLGSDS